MTDIVTWQAEARTPAIAERAPLRPIVVVVGMHRSGTSLCSNILSILGVDMADEASPDDGNPLGHFERWDLVALQDEVLALFNRSYFSPTHDYPLPSAWWADLRVRPIVDRIKATLAPILARGGLIGFKDPRTTRLLPLWNRIFADLGLEPRFAVCLREPAHVAASLLKRDKLDAAAGELRTLDYMVDALRYTRGRERCFLRYGDWMSDPFANVRKLLRLLHADGTIESNDLRMAIEETVRPEYNRSAQPGVTARQPLVRHFFELASRFAEKDGTDEATDGQITRFVEQYVAFRQTLVPYEAQQRASIQAHEGAATRLAEVERALATLSADHAQMVAERETSAAHVKHLEFVIKTERDAARATAAEAEAARRQLEAALNQVRQDHAQAEEALSAQGGLDPVLSQAHEERAQALQRAADAEADARRLDAALRALTREHETLRHRSAELETDMAIRLHQRAGEVDGAALRARTAEDENTRLQGLIEAERKTTADLTGALNDARLTLAKLTQDLAASEQARQEAERHVLHLEHVIREERRTVAEAHAASEARHAELELAHGDAKARVADLDETRARLAEAVSGAQAAHRKAEADKTALASAHDTARREIEHLQAMLAKAREHQARTDEARHKAEADRAALTDAFDAAQRELATLQTALAEAREDLARLEDRHRAAEADRAALDAAHAAARQEITALQTALAETRERHAEADAARAQAAAEVVTMADVRDAALRHVEHLEHVVRSDRQEAAEAQAALQAALHQVETDLGAATEAREAAMQRINHLEYVIGIGLEEARHREERLVSP